MQKTNRHILSTRPLPKAIIEEAASQTIIIEQLSFIHTTPIEDVSITKRIQELSGQNCTVIFTSMNAVEAVANKIERAPNWKIYSIGNTTKKLIEEKLSPSQIIATADNAVRLGERLMDDKVEHVVFFCGNIRRDELPNKLRSEKVMVEEVIVYETTETPSALHKEYDGILFFSPSAVHSFYKTNQPDKHTHLFAIGKTTAEAIRQYQNKKIIIATTADKVELARQAIEFFKNVNTA